MRRLISFLAVLLIGVFLSPKAMAEPIKDNSFLIEEAYNQEAGVVQHINLFVADPDNDSWDYFFAQEWPLGSQAHQFSYTIPISRVSDPDETGLSDMAVNYRYQVPTRDGVAFAPRTSLILPTGDSGEGLGSDELGYQINLPLSVELSDLFVMHWNLGAAYTPNAKEAGGGEADNTSFNYGASIVYLFRPTFNFLVEAVGTSREVTLGDNSTDREENFFINPGVRMAINFDSGLQIVPGVAVPLGVGASDGEYGVIGYLSFEHSFL